MGSPRTHPCRLSHYLKHRRSPALTVDGVHLAGPGNASLLRVAEGRESLGLEAVCGVRRSRTVVAGGMPDGRAVRLQRRIPPTPAGKGRTG